MDKIEMHKELCDLLNETYIKKNADYGDSFGETYKKLGIISAVTRISDKYNRLVSLCTKPEEERMVKDESITDTLLDMANYCLMTVIEMKNDRQASECMHEWRYAYQNGDGHNYKCVKCKAIKTVPLGNLMN